MKLYVLFGQRKEDYEGQFGVEALYCASEYDMDENPEYLHKKKELQQRNEDFEALEIVTLEVNEAEIEAILRLKHKTVQTKIVME